MTKPAHKYIPVTEVDIFNIATGEIDFRISFINRHVKEFVVVPGGSDDIHAALKRRNMHETHMAQLFFMRETSMYSTPRRLMDV